MRHGADRPTRQPATPCRSARPRKPPGAGRCRCLRLQLAVELRLREKSAGSAQDVVGAAQLSVLPLQLLDAFSLAGGDAFALSAVDFVALDPGQQRLRRAADLGRDGLDRHPQRRVLAARLLHQAHGALAHFRGKLVCVVLAHGSHSLKSESLRKTRGDSLPEGMEILSKHCKSRQRWRARS